MGRIFLGLQVLWREVLGAVVWSTPSHRAHWAASALQLPHKLPQNIGRGLKRAGKCFSQGHNLNVSKLKTGGIPAEFKAEETVWKIR